MYRSHLVFVFVLKVKLKIPFTIEKERETKGRKGEIDLFTVALSLKMIIRTKIKHIDDHYREEDECSIVSRW